MMVSVKIRCCICWCILLRYLVTCVISHSTELNKSDSLMLGEGLNHPHSGSFLSDGTQTSASSRPEELRFSSQTADFASCEDLEGVGSFNSTCLLSSNLHINADIYVVGSGNLEILPHVSIVCPVEGCTISFKLSGSVKVGQNATIVSGTVIFSAFNLTMEPNSSINTTAWGGTPPSQTSGTPVGNDGAGGGHGGRGASCLKTNQTNNWGGDAYSWTTLSSPWAYGSKGGGTSDIHEYGGNGGGRVLLDVKDILYINGSVSAEGGDGGSLGGGGSGGSIIIQAQKLKGFGIISAAGGRGWGGGGGGRISLNCYSKQEDVKVIVHGGWSIGCSWNAGAAGTYFDAYVLSLRVGNDNITTETETPLLYFSTSPLWTNIYVENNAKVLVPLFWTRVQVRGQISLYCRSSIIFGLSEYPVSEFELVAEELLMSDSVIQVYGAFRVAVKMLLMLNSQIQVDGGGNTVVATSVLEVRNLVVLKDHSVISSNGNLALYGQGLLQLTGQGDAIKGQRLSLSLFYNITVGPGSLLQAPLDDEESRSSITKSLCESSTCPVELITPPDDCHVNYTLSFSLQVCRVEDILVNGLMRGSIIHIHRARTVIVDSDGMITASELGCRNGVGRGNYSNGAGAGAGHGGRGGSGCFSGKLSEGGPRYGSADLPCELGSGTVGPNDSYGYVAGGGMIVMGSRQWPLLRLDIYGSIRVDGQSCHKPTRNSNGTLIGGLGGGSGGTILLFLQGLALAEGSSLSVAGGYGGPLGGGGGGGGRIHFHWSKIAIGDEYVPLAFVDGMMNNSGGAGSGDGLHGEKGTITGKKCPKGLYGTFCTECPVGTYKDVEGSDPNLCTACSLERLPNRANFIYVRGGVTSSSCPYKCISDKYRTPKCFTPFEELIYMFGGPWFFAFLLLGVIVLLALVLNTLRIKLIGSGRSYHREDSVDHHENHRFPSLLSLSEVRGARAEETQNHVHRMYFMGPNTFREPWHLSYSPPHAIVEIVYEDAFNRFIDEINSVAAYEWWEGSVHRILSVLAYPFSWSWKQWRRRNKLHRLQEFVKSEYDHSCLRSCRSRALYKGMKHVPATVWNRLVAGLNAQLRTVRQGSIRSALVPVINWIVTHGNPQLDFHGVRIELGWFQATASGYYQLGILVVAGDCTLQDLHHSEYLDSDAPSRKVAAIVQSSVRNQLDSQMYTSHALSRKKITGGINGGLIDESTLKLLGYRRDYLFPFSLLLHNTRSVGRQETIQLFITIMLLADLFVTLLMLFLFYWISLGAFLAVLLILPLSLLSTFLAGLNALFSNGPRRAALARIYALWNVSSISNIAVAFLCGLIHNGISSSKQPGEINIWNLIKEDERWWLLPTILLLFKAVQARFVDWHIANLEVRDFSLFSPDPDTFWAYESVS
ncbi:transmembrane [Olea europaea subsp. europaea]|uniref:Transmembrane n=1 Tax=Olea europaea subsp. europaea TaxID=158383 RepID=A0A8S0R7Z4_OLEEU|nr:transmembrane [Olea europaea subsp. europaea]